MPGTYYLYLPKVFFFLLYASTTTAISSPGLRIASTVPSIHVEIAEGDEVMTNA